MTEEERCDDLVRDLLNHNNAAIFVVFDPNYHIEVTQNFNENCLDISYYGTKSIKSLFTENHIQLSFDQDTSQDELKKLLPVSDKAIEAIRHLMKEFHEEIGVRNACGGIEVGLMD